MDRFPESLKSQASGVLLDCINGLENFLAHIEETFKKRSYQFVPTPTTPVSHHEYIGEVLWFIYGIYLAKYRELLSAAIRSVGEQNFLLFALCGRTVIETTATLRYYNEKLLALAGTAKDPDRFSKEELDAIVEILDRHSRGGSFDWSKFWWSPRKELAEQLVAARKEKKGRADQSLPNPVQVNALTALDTWAAEEPGIQLAYAFFCELVHPNLGSNFLTMEAKDGHLQVCGDSDKGVGRSLAIEGIKFLASSVRIASLSMAKLLYMAATTKKLPGDQATKANGGSIG